LGTSKTPPEFVRAGFEIAELFSDVADHFCMSLVNPSCANHNALRLAIIKMTADGVLDFLLQLLVCIGLRKNGVVLSASFKPTLGRFFKHEDYFGIQNDAARASL
jgi:hypothetical protein